MKQLAYLAVDRGDNMDMRDKWYDKTIKGWNEDEALLRDTVGNNADLFGDLIFEEGSITYPFIAVKSSFDDGKTWIDDEIAIPEELNYFSYNFFDLKVEKINGEAYGEFDPATQTITIDPDHLRDEATILHEMIHSHEYVLNDLLPFYREVCFFCLYKSLRDKINNLDKIIEGHGHILSQSQFVDTASGVHDILFLLKSLDLDLKKGYKLGTVFGYGYQDNLTT